MLARIFHLIADLGGFAYAVVSITRAVVYWCGGPVQSIPPFSQKEIEALKKNGSTLPRHEN